MNKALLSSQKMDWCTPKPFFDKLNHEFHFTLDEAYDEALTGAKIVLLIPARTDTIYFHKYIYGKAEIRFIRGRLRFTDEDGNTFAPAPFPSMLVIYNSDSAKNNH